ncbi:class I SAM-dependent methyltransferase [Aromatoleum petrolei]|uniref:Methyltransferase domain-containing protein n=1 Tax=Aromatoleum petrolei TaxID=76116 RepID=A0ABX1ML51_9RHOO|nr:class I SAM-dependent methyltransferase [Aromatoleum petrolei]NMF88458.1 methyltransferase domain-containing protein [Aromatoleum petrolei]
MYECKGCGSAYLDPRPDRATIGLAYANYYTHSSQGGVTVRRIGAIRTLLHDWLNGYLNCVYGLRRRPAKPLGRLLIPLLVPLRAAADAECRHLPRPPAGGGALLDVGCGNGQFLSMAREMGWNAEGVDFDECAVNAARSAGLQVRLGGIELFDGERERYDVITLSHVIEHIHDPIDLLGRIHRLLKPGGILWLETPNLSSAGHRLYGPNWRGLEPPRHLVLFNATSLCSVLYKAGFSHISQKFPGLVLYSVFAASEAIERGGDVLTASRRGRPKMSDVLVEAYEMIVPWRREFLTYLARKEK